MATDTVPGRHWLRHLGDTQIPDFRLHLFFADGSRRRRDSIMLVELGVVEQRYQAVLEVLNGVPVVEVARRYGVARQTVHDWLRRYGSQGMAGLVDRSSKPLTCPHQTPTEIEARITELRRAHPGWGPRTIGYQLGREGKGCLRCLPARRSIGH